MLYQLSYTPRPDAALSRIGGGCARGLHRGIAKEPTGGIGSLQSLFRLICADRT